MAYRDRLPRVSRQERVDQFGVAAEGLTFLMDFLVVLRLHRFHLSPAEASYSGSAATLKEEAIKAMFPSPTASPSDFT